MSAAVFSLRVVVFAISALCVSAPAIQAVPQDDAREEKTPSPTPAPPSPARESKPKPTSKIDGPWSAGVSYRYSWAYDGAHVGETRFSIEALKETPGAKRSPRYNVRATHSYRREAHDEKASRSMLFDASWSLLHFDSTTFVDYATNLKSRRASQGWREGDLFVNIVMFNEEEESRVRAELKTPRDAMVLIPQAVEIWALTLPRIGTVIRGKKPVVLLAYPEFGKIYQVSFASNGSEKIAVSKTETVECQRFKFATERKELVGEIWVDSNDRLVRYAQGKLAIQLKS